MSCENYKTKLSAAAAAGLADAALPEHLAGHLCACVDCREWFASEQGLFSAIDAGIARVVDQAPSAEFLSRVRVAVELEKSSRTFRVPGFRFSLWPITAAVAVAWLALVFVGRFHSRSAVQPQSAATVGNSGAAVTSPVLQPVVEAGGPQPDGVRHTVVKSARATAGWVDGEVLVSSDEREALAHFVAGLPARREVAIALARPAPFQPPSFQPPTDETAAGPLEIAELEIKPLIPVEEK
jgi:hypothetical protein